MLTTNTDGASGKIPVRRDDAIALYLQLLEGHRPSLRKEFYQWHESYNEGAYLPEGVLALHRSKLYPQSATENKQEERSDTVICPSCQKPKYDQADCCIADFNDWCTCNSEWDLGWEHVDTSD